MMKKMLCVLMALLMLGSAAALASGEEPVDAVIEEPVDAAVEEPAADGGPTLFNVHLEIYMIDTDGKLVPNAGGTATVSTTAAEPGELVTVTASAGPNCVLESVDYGNGAVIGTDITGEMCFYMPEYTTFVAVWFRELPSHALVVDTEPYGAGQVMSSRNPDFWVSVIDLAHVPEGAVTLEARAYDDYRFVGWADKAGTVISAQNPYTLVTKGDVELKAVFEEKPEYSFTDGAGSTWTKGGGEELYLTVERRIYNSEAYLLFQEALINGVSMQMGTDYDYTTGVEVVLYPSFLEKLAPGTYTVKAVFANGECETTITVKDKVGLSIAGDCKTAKVTGDFAGLYARVALVIKNGETSGLYVTQATINDDGTIVVPTFFIPGLTVVGVNIALVPALADISSSTPNTMAVAFKYM